MDREHLGAVILLGPTACGKDAAGNALATMIGAEIICMDSMKVFKGMDAATDKPSPEERARVSYHLLDVADPRDTFDLSRYLEAAAAAEREIRARGRVALYVGGTALYVRGLLWGLDPAVPADEQIRGRLRKKAEKHGPAALHARLLKIDPERAREIDPADLRRVIRALEIALITGKRPSQFRSSWKGPPRRTDVALLGLARRRSALHARINARVEEYFAAGVLEEASALLESGIGQVAAQALAYRHAFLCATGELEPREAIEQVQARTRQFAKRQMTWFHDMPGVRWLGIDGDPEPREIAEKLRALLQRTEPAPLDPRYR